MNKRILFLAATAAAAMTWSATAWAACPPQGSGLDGVDAWIAENCNSDACENPATTCNGDFTIELLDVTYDGALVTFEYDVCQIDDGSALSHWGIGLGQISCYGVDEEGNLYDASDLVVAATLNGQPTDFEVGLDPTTQLFGIKFDEGVEEDTCNNFTVTFDTSVLAEGYTLGVGCTPAATKAGNQDITLEDRQTPGYACIGGPVCQEEEDETCWEDETAWADGDRYVARGNWATYTSYQGVEKTVTLYAGQTIVAGEVIFTPQGPDEISICIVLNEGFRFADDDENVKIQDYAEAPSGNPNPGEFAHKGEGTGGLFCIRVPDNGFYGVHVDVEREVECVAEEEVVEE